MGINHGFSSEWHSGLCENCMKNSHERHPVKLKTMVSTFDETKFSDMYVCSKCGYTRRL